MFIEKRQENDEIVVMSGCSGCSNNGKSAYSSNYSDYQASNAGRCSSGATS